MTIVELLGIGIVVMTFAVNVNSQQREDSYMEAYQESHYPGQYFSLDDMSFRMPMEDMKNDSVIPFVIKIAALVAKILLKLTLFKIVVKFIAVVCLFLFIPKLKLKRSFVDGMDKDGYLDSLADIVRSSLEKYKQEEN